MFPSHEWHQHFHCCSVTRHGTLRSQAVRAVVAAQEYGFHFDCGKGYKFYPKGSCLGVLDSSSPTIQQSKWGRWSTWISHESLVDHVFADPDEAMPLNSLVRPFASELSDAQTNCQDLMQTSTQWWKDFIQPYFWNELCLYQQDNELAWRSTM